MLPWRRPYNPTDLACPVRWFGVLGLVFHLNTYRPVKSGVGLDLRTPMAVPGFWSPSIGGPSARGADTLFPNAGSTCGRARMLRRHAGQCLTRAGGAIPDRMLPRLVAVRPVLGPSPSGAMRTAFGGPGGPCVLSGASPRRFAPALAHDLPRRPFTIRQAGDLRGPSRHNVAQALSAKISIRLSASAGRGRESRPGY